MVKVLTLQKAPFVRVVGSGRATRFLSVGVEVQDPHTVSTDT